MSRLEKGDPIPEFVLADQNGSEVTSADYRGRNLLVYVYPKANTSG